MDAERVRAGMSRGDLAAALGWSLSRLQRRISGDSPITIDELFAVAAALGCSVDRLTESPVAA